MSIPRCGGVAGKQADAHAGRQRNLLLREDERPGQGELHAPGHDLRCIRRGHTGQRQGEFVAAGARDPIVDVLLSSLLVVPVHGRLVLAQAVLQAPRNLRQQHIAHRLSLRVVDPGEIVDVEHQHGEAALPRRGPRDLLFQYLQQSLPIRQRSQRVVIGKVAHPRFAFAQLILCLLGAHQEFDPLGQQHRIDALGGKIRGSRVVGAIHRLHVIETGLHQYGHVAAFRECAQRPTHVKAVHAGHDHVEHHAVGGLLAELLQRRDPVDRCRYIEARHFQGGPDQQPCAGIIVDDQNRCRNDELVLECVHCVLSKFTPHWAIARAPKPRKNRDIPCEFSAGSTPPA
jgi:hypothetical protein